MDRLSFLGEDAVMLGKGLDFAWEVFKLLWDGQSSDWTEGEQLEEAAKSAGIDLMAMESRVACNTENYRARVVQNTKERDVHHWGGPVMVYKDEAFHGQDRLDQVIWRIEQNAKRAIGE